MKTLFRLGFSLFFVVRLLAHDHIEVGIDSGDSSRLALAGPAAQIALYVPPGEPFSGYLPHFPGGVYANELSFSAEGNVLEFAEGSLARIELVSVTGPAGASFSFWEVGATAPTWTRPVGWTATEGDRPSLKVYEDNTGYGHIHGRAFSVDHPGTYQISFRAIDETGSYGTSAIKTLTLNALATPQLVIRIVAGSAKLTFTSRLNLTYDLQVSTDLVTWGTVAGQDFISGTGGVIELTDPLNNRPRVFYRLVEYF